jgi:hypothetical protein
MQTQAPFRAGRNHGGRALALVVAMTLGGAVPALADDPLCVGSILGSLHPKMDGSIASDQGWANSGQYAFNNGTTQPDAVIHMTRDASKLYFAFEVNNDKQYNEEDVIILLLGPTANPADDWRIHIYPVGVTGPGPVILTDGIPTGGNLPRLVKVWKNSGAWVANAATPNAINPTWMEVGVTAVAAGPTSHTYWVEAAIDLAAAEITLPAGAAPFKLHFNVLRFYKVTTGGITDTYVEGQLNWPTVATVPGLPTPPPDSHLFANPTRANWGDAIQNSYSPCQGVRVKSAWINTAGNHSTLTPPPVGGSVTNNYFVQIENAGTAPAGHVLASIHAWRFGIAPGSSFGLIPGTSHLSSFAAAPATPINPGANVTLGPAAWTISREDYDADYASTPLVCSLIQLDVDNAHTAGVTRTLIGNRFFYWNTHFAPASVFRQAALLETRGFQAPGDGSGQQRFHLLVTDREIPGRPGRGEVPRTPPSDQAVSFEGRQSGEPARFLPDSVLLDELSQVGGVQRYEQGAAFFVRSVCGFRHTARYITVDGTPVELMERTPCYGYWIYHLGKMSGWRRTLRAPGLDRLADGLYSIAVPENGSVELTTHIEAVETGPLSFGVRAGVAVPHGTFNNTWDPGFAIDADLEYALTPSLAFQLVGGYRSFTGPADSTMSIMRLSGNAKLYLGGARFRPFVNGGAGVYVVDPGDTSYGGNLGAGLVLGLSDRLGIEAAYNYYLVKQPVTDPTFSTVEAGLRLRL